MRDPFDTLRDVLASNVRRLRNAKGLSQEELAFEANIDRTYVSQIERSVINPSLRILYKVGVALEADVTQLLTPPPKPEDNNRPEPAQPPKPLKQ